MTEPSRIARLRLYSFTCLALIVVGLLCLRSGSEILKLPPALSWLFEAQGVHGGGVRGKIGGDDGGGGDDRTFEKQKYSIQSLRASGKRLVHVTNLNTSLPRLRPYGDGKLPTNHSIIYCYGEGGLNDILVQLMKCVQYANKTGRELWLDHRLYRAPEGRERYFKLGGIPGVQVGGYGRGFYHTGMSVYPMWYQLDRDVDLKWRNSSVGHGAGLDFSSSREENVVVHRNSGGGVLSAKLVPFLNLSSEVMDAVRSRHQLLGGRGKQYIAVHSRSPHSRRCHEVPDVDHLITNTRRHADKHPSWPIFVAADSADTLRRFREVFGPNRTVTFTTIPADTRGEMHSSLWLPVDVLHQANIDAFADLFLLAFADVLVTSCGGYSRLAGFLHHDQRTVSRLVGLANR